VTPLVEMPMDRLLAVIALIEIYIINETVLEIALTIELTK
jgi:hypothetical protein